MARCDPPRFPAYAALAWFARLPGTSLPHMASAPRSARLLQGLVLAICVVPLVQACGGRSDTEDFLYGDTVAQGAQGNGTAGTRQTGGTPGTGATTGTGAVGVGATQGIGGDIVGTAGDGVGGSGTGGSTGVAGSPFGGTGVGGSVSVAGSGPIGGTGAAGGPSMSCGAQTCDTSTQLCCAAIGGTGCVSRKQGCAGATLTCTTNQDCAGNGVCCLSLTGSADVASSCKPACNNFGATRDRQLCQQDSDCQLPQRFCTETVFGVSVCTRRP